MLRTQQIIVFFNEWIKAFVCLFFFSYSLFICLRESTKGGEGEEEKQAPH